MMNRDKAGKLYYASLQGQTANEELEKHHLETVDTIILKVNDQFYLQSSAALRAFAYLGGVYKLSTIFLIVPAFIRNWFYQIISKNRYRWFGKKEVCRMPTEEEKERLLG